MFYLKYRFRVISILVPAVLFVSACTQPMATDSQARLARNAVPSSLAHIPFAGDDELAAIDSRKDSSIIPWKLARRLAYIELRTTEAKRFDWTGATLSERPVVVYNGKSIPEYYEFIVYDSQHGALGTLTTYATKSAAGIIAYVLPYLRKYPLLSKSPGYGEFTVSYPNWLLVGVAGKSGNDPIGIIDPNTGNSSEIIQLIPTEEYFDEMRMESDNNIMQEFGVDRADFETGVTEYKAERNEYRKTAEEYWRIIDKNAEKLLTLTDAEIDAKSVATKSTWWTGRNRVLYTSDPHDMDSISALHRTRWQGWCVPSALAWVYMAEGIRDGNSRGVASYDGKPLYTVDDAEFPLDLIKYVDSGRESTGGRDKKPVDSRYGNQYTGAYAYQTSYDKHSIVREAPIKRMSEKMDGGLYHDLMVYGDAFLKKGGVSSIESRLNYMLDRISKTELGAKWITQNRETHDSIYRKHLPVLASGTFRGDEKNGRADGSHMIVLIGTIEETKYWDTQFLGFLWWYTESRAETRRWLVHDNGTITRKKTGLLKAGKYERDDGGATHSNKGRKAEHIPYWVDDSELQHYRGRLHRVLH